MTNMDKVEALIGQGITEREEMATKAGITGEQVRRALERLVNAGRIESYRKRMAGRWKGRKQSLYRIRPKVLRHSVVVNSVFALGNT